MKLPRVRFTIRKLMVASEAVMVWEPSVDRVAAKVPTPLCSVAEEEPEAGTKLAVLSLLVRFTVPP